jgi:hypothetical protein
MELDQRESVSSIADTMSMMEIESKENKQSPLAKEFEIQFQDPYLAELYYLIESQSNLAYYQIECPKVVVKYPRVYELFFKMKRACKKMSISFLYRTDDEGATVHFGLYSNHEVAPDVIKKQFNAIPYINEPVNFTTANAVDVLKKLRINKVMINEIDMRCDQEKLKSILTKAEYELFEKIQNALSVENEIDLLKKTIPIKVKASRFSEDVKSLIEFYEKNKVKIHKLYDK